MVYKNGGNQNKGRENGRPVLYRQYQMYAEPYLAGKPDLGGAEENPVLPQRAGVDQADWLGHGDGRAGGGVGMVKWGNSIVQILSRKMKIEIWSARENFYAELLDYGYKCMILQ